MKNIKKLTLVTLLSAGVIFTTACSQVANQTTEKKAEQKQETKLSNEEILKKSIEAVKNLKSYEGTMEENSYIAPETMPEPSPAPLKSKHAYIIDKLSYRSESSDGYAQYLVDNYVYRKSNNTWVKWSLTPERLENVKKQALTLYNIETVLNFKKDYTVTETDTTYVIEFKPTDLKELTKIYYADSSATTKENSSVEIYYDKITLDKKSFLPLSSENEFKSVSLPEGDQVKIKRYSKGKTTYSNFNSVPAITLPEEAKNAQGM